MDTELIELEKAFADALVRNDVKAIETFVAPDWVIVDPHGGIVEREYFLQEIESGALVHESMEVNDFRIRRYGDAAVVTALTSTNGKFRGEEFGTRERSTDVFVKRDGRWQCVITHLTRLQKR